MKKPGGRDRLAELFRSRPNEWISAYVLMDTAGKMAWRTRVSDVRRRLNMRIDSDVRRDARGVAESFYRFVPVQRGQAGLFA
jgi:hypothetical protein